MPIYFTHKSGAVIKLEASVYSDTKNVDAKLVMLNLLDMVPAGEIISGPEIRRHGWDRLPEHKKKATP